MESIPEKVADELLDPLGRLYRRKLAWGIARLLSPTFIGPNQVTLIHTAVGVAAAYLIYVQHYLAAVLLFELRTILDCTDGILARMKNEVTSIGRTLDTIGDGITFNALMIAGAVRMMNDFPTYRPSLILIAVFTFAMLAAHCGTVYQLMKRKLGSIVFQQIDTVEREWREQANRIKVGEWPLITQFGFWLDSMTIRFISEEWFQKIERRRHAEDWEKRALSDACTMNELARYTRRREFRNAVRSTAFVSDDNIFAVIGAVFLLLECFPSQIFPNVHPVLLAFSAGFAYATVSLMIGLHYLHRFYHGVYRD